MTTCVVWLLVPWLAAAAPANPLWFDMGTAQSAVWDGCTWVTADTVYSAETGFGWQTRDGLRAQARAYKEPVENKSRGTTEQPPIWTNAVTEDSISSTRENAFVVRAAPGEYGVYVLCGTSDPQPSQVFDFTVQAGAQPQRVLIEGGHLFRAVRFRVQIGNEPLTVRFTPRNKWVVNAILAWPVADAARIEQELIRPLEEWTYRMPPSEWAKWRQDAEPEPGRLPPVSPADTARGFLVFARHYLECVYPHTAPRAEELNPELRLFATPGEYEPVNFIVHPLRDLAAARVTVSAIGPVAADRVDVRHVRFLRARPNYTVLHRYRVVPDVLEPFERLELSAGENARFWLTVHVPEDAPPGDYRGQVTFACSGGQAQVPIRLRVLPIRLREDPGKLFGIYYRHPLDLAASAPDEISREYFRRRADLEHTDMVAHGTRNVVLSAWSPPADAQGRFQFRWELLEEKLALWKKHGFRGPIVMSFNTDGVYRKHMRESYGSHLRGVKEPPEEFGRELTALVRAIEAERQKRGWPEFLYYPVDEPSTEPAAVNFMVTVLKACKAAGVRTYVTADPTHEQFEPLRPWVDVWCTQPFAPDRETVLADMRARRVEYWCYPNHVNGENDHTPVAGARMTYGFGFWRSGFLTLIPWIYSWRIGDPFNYLDGSSMDFFNRHAPDGTPMPVALWEAYREGYDDYRYVFTLEQLIAAARRSGKPAANQAAESAARELKFVWDSIRVQTKYKHDGLWAPAEFEVYRWLIAQQILAVQAALE
jgi:hypothetical protein